MAKEPKELKGSLLERIKAASSIKETATLDKTKIYEVKDSIPLPVPMMNVAFSGELDGGFIPGLTQWCGPSRHFKTGFLLLQMKSFMDKYPDGVVLFYNSEFGSPKSYFEAYNIDTSRVIVTPIVDIEELKVDITTQIHNFQRGDKVFIGIDSIGNLASRKEVEDALENKSVADMTRAKQLKSLFRIVTPHLMLKEIPMVVVNHTYKEIGMFPKDIVGGGCVVAGTKIITDNGLKNVENFNVGDLVLTLDGYKEVSAVWNPDTLDDGEPECFDIEFEDGYVVTCSAEHKFLIDGLWVCAKDLVVNQNVSVV